MAGRRLGRQEFKKRQPEIQERDLDVFNAIQKARAVTSASLVPLLFPSIPVARRRLRKLASDSYLVGFAPALHTETQYVLDRRAVDELRDAGVEVNHRQPPRNFQGYGAHHDGLVRFWSDVAHACHVHPDYELLRWDFEWELADGHLNTVTKFRPDALFVVDDGTAEHVFFVEYDRDTTARYLPRKLELFERIYAARAEIFGESATGVLIVTENERRLDRLLDALKGSTAPVFGRVIGSEGGEQVLDEGWKQPAVNEGTVRVGGALLGAAGVARGRG